MASDRNVFGFALLLLTVGLIALVYGMELSAGQAMNGPAIAGGVLILVAISAMVLRIANIDTH